MPHRLRVTNFGNGCAEAALVAAGYHDPGTVRRREP
jgi:hypothetical protein